MDQFKDIKRKNIGFRVMDNFITSSWSYWNLYANEQWEPKTLQTIDNILPPNGTMYDIGAWMGPMSLWAAKTKQARVIAIEPDPEAYRQLNNNIALNKLDSLITTLNIAITDQEGIGKLGIIMNGDSASSMTRPANQKQVEVECHTLRWLTDRYGPVDVIKMDIEGSESLIIPDFEPVLWSNCKYLVLALHQRWYVEKHQNTDMLSILKDWDVKQIEGDNYLCKSKGAK